MNKTHLIVAETVSLQGQFPDTKDTRYYINLTDDQPFVRYFTLESSRGDVPLDMGWIKEHAIILVRCDEKRDEHSVVAEPTPERMTSAEWGALVTRAKDRTAHMMQLARDAKNNALVLSVNGTDFTEVPIGQSQRIVTVPGATYSMRMRAGKAKVSIHVYPRDMS